MIIKLAQRAGWRCMNSPAPQQEQTHRLIGFLIPNEECGLHESVEDIMLKLLPVDTAIPALFIEWVRRQQGRMK